MSTVTVIIVNWNAGTLLADCIRHLRAQTRLPDQVLLVDNASTDGSLGLLPAWDRMTVMPMADNLGFAAGNNRALAVASTEYVALLNPDAFAATDWLEQLLLAATQFPQSVAFGSRQLQTGPQALLDGIGDRYHCSGLAWREAHGARPSPAHLIPREVFSPCAAAALYRRSALDAAGGFDESYFCYLEDVDLGFRLRLAGASARYVPQAVVHHVGSATSGGQQSDFAVFHGHRNMVWTFVKNMPGPLLWLLLPAHLLANLATWLLFAARGRPGVIWRAKLAALRGLGAAWRARQPIQAQRTASAWAIWAVLDKSIRPRRRG